MKKVEELKRTPNLLINSISEDGGNGFIFEGRKPFCSVVFSWGAGWEHVSVAPLNRRIVPSWDFMCKVKDMFFNPEEWAVQFHPAKSEYVNNLPNCLHLWRSLNEPQPIPPSILTGIKDGQIKEEIAELIEQLSEV